MVIDRLTLCKGVPNLPLRFRIYFNCFILIQFIVFEWGFTKIMENLDYSPENFYVFLESKVLLLVVANINIGSSRKSDI